MIQITTEEAQNIYDFIRSTLYNDWDRYTDVYICRDSLEDGMRRMCPELYDFANELQRRIDDAL